MSEKPIIPFKIGEYLPAKGFLWRVMEANRSEVRLQVCGVSKAGKKMGYVVNFQKDDPLMLKGDAFDAVE